MYEEDPDAPPPKRVRRELRVEPGKSTFKPFNPFDTPYLWQAKSDIALAQQIAKSNANLLTESRNKLIAMFNSMESSDPLLINLFT